MSDEQKTYVEFKAGGIVSADEMNEMQSLICADIKAQVAEAIAALTEVPNAEDSEKLAGETPQELLDRFLEKAMQEFPSHTGHLMAFKRLVHDEPKKIEHNLKVFPLVDVYELKPFPVVCAHDDDKHVEQVRIFLYHSSEKKIRNPNPDDGGPASITIEETDGEVFRIPLFELLDLLDVPYDDGSSLQDLEAEFWDKLFESPSDAFDPDEYCHSPWFERCCREERTVGSLKDKGDADELYATFRPQKTINPALTTGDGNLATDRCPRDLTVSHLDFNTVSLRFVDPTAGGDQTETPALYVVALLKV